MDEQIGSVHGRFTAFQFADDVSGFLQNAGNQCICRLRELQSHCNAGRQLNDRLGQFPGIAGAIQAATDAFEVGLCGGRPFLIQLHNQLIKQRRDAVTCGSGSVHH